MSIPFRRYAGAVQRRGIPVIAGGRSMQAGFTFTRPDPATYFDASGLLQTASAGEARTTYIDGAPYLWIDGAVTEISGKSHDISAWNTNTSASVAEDAVGLDGENNTGFTVTDDSDSVQQTRQNNVSISTGSETYYWVWAQKADAAPTHYAQCVAGMAGGTSQGTAPFVLDPSDGTYNVSTKTNFGVVLEPVRFGDFWVWVLSFINNGTNTIAVEKIDPAINTDGSLSGDVTVQGSTVFGYVGLFKDNFSLMPILTTGGTTKTVAADVASLANSVIAGMTEGTMYAEVWVPGDQGTARIANLSSDSSNEIELRIVSGANDGSGESGGVAQWRIVGGAWQYGTLEKVAMAWKQNDVALYKNGAQDGTDTSATIPDVDQLKIGRAVFDNLYLHGGIKTLNVYTSRLPNAQLASMTT